MTDLQHMMVPDPSIGYGRMGVMIDQELRKLGVAISNDIDATPAGTVLHCSTPAHLLKYYDGQRLVLFSMWESANLPEAFRESLHVFDTVIVPSEQNQALFSAFHDDVRYVPLGIDPTVWHHQDRTAPTQRFEFLIGGSGPRKGVDLAYRAFQQAFPTGSWGDGPEPWLLLKSPRHSPFQGERISQLNGRLSAADEVALYARAHCYLQPSRGEGFGLQPLQALAQGCPTILTDAHGHASFARYGYPIPATLTATVPGSFMYGEAGDWWEPDVEVLAERMREVYDNYDSACAYAQIQGGRVRREFTWAETARKVKAILDPLPPYTGSGQVRVPERKLYRIVLTHHHAADIAGASYRWEPFADYWVVADIKRILFEGNHLDPCCIYGDSGITPDRLTADGLLTGAESVCGTCHQVLNSQPSRADRVEAMLNATDPLPSGLIHA